MIKGSIHQEDVIIITICALCSSKIYEEKNVKRNRQLITTVVDFSTSALLDRKFRQNINNRRLKNTINQLNITDIYRQHSTANNSRIYTLLRCRKNSTGQLRCYNIKQMLKNVKGSQLQSTFPH